MIKQRGISSWLGKIILVFLTLFSQFHIPLEVLAEELEKNDDTVVLENDSNEEIEPEEKKEDADVTDNVSSNDEKVSVGSDANTDDTILLNEEEKKEDSNDTISLNEEKQDGNESVDDVANTENSGVSNVRKTREVKASKYVVTVNGEDVDEYTISDNKVLNIHQTYDGEDGTYKFSTEDEVIDFSHAIYGDYQLVYVVLSADNNEVLDEKEITVHYNGDNSEILDKYTDLDYSDGTYSIRGSNKKITVSDVLSKFDNSFSDECYLLYEEVSSGDQFKINTKMVIVGDNDVQLDSSDEITSNSKIVFEYTNEMVVQKYSIKIEGDYNDDGLVDIEDAKLIIDNILAGGVKEDGSSYSILDATNSVFTTGIWDNSPSVFDSLSNSLSTKGSVYQGEEFEVNYYINGFDKDVLNGLSGKINYDSNIIELVGIDSEALYGDYNDDLEFAYLFDNFSSDDVLLTFKFKGVNPGTANISVSDIVASNGNVLNLDGDSIDTSVEVLELPKGGDVEEDSTTNDNNSNNSVVSTTTADNVVNNSVSGVYIPRYVALSSDNYIKSLTIDGYDIDFDMYKYNYSIKVKNSVTSLKMEVILNDPSAKYEIHGNSNFKVGDNVVEIVVTAENGETRTYTINVKREKKDEVVVKKVNNGAAKPVIIILILLVIAGLIYVIFKDDEEEGKKKS